MKVLVKRKNYKHDVYFVIYSKPEPRRSAAYYMVQDGEDETSVNYSC